MSEVSVRELIKGQSNIDQMGGEILTVISIIKYCFERAVEENKYIPRQITIEPNQKNELKATWSISYSRMSGLEIHGYTSSGSVIDRKDPGLIDYRSVPLSMVKVFNDSLPNLLDKIQEEVDWFSVFALPFTETVRKDG